MIKQKALVTGATGFIGANLVRRLVREGWDVHVVVRPDSDRSSLKDAGAAITVHTHDGSAEGMVDLMGAASPEIVFHVASLFLAQHGTKDVGPLIGSNILFATQLVEAMAANGVYRLINTGTSWQHYQSSDYDPVNLYAATKQAFEDILAYYVATTPLRAITLKLYDTYGPNDPRPKLMHLLGKVAQSGEHLSMSPGEQLIDLVYIDDVIEAYWVGIGVLGAQEPGSHRTYAVTSGAPLPLRELVDLYGQFLGRPLPIGWGERPYRQREVMVPWNRGDVLPGWRPRVSLGEGIERIVKGGGQGFAS